MFHQLFKKVILALTLYVSKITTVHLTHSLWERKKQKQKTNVYLASKFFLILHFYTTKGRDRFHWAATPLKPYKIGNICYMTYRYSVLYFLNLSLKHFFPQKTAIFVKISKSFIFRVLTLSRMPNQRTSQSKIEDIVHCKCISLLN